MRYFHLNILRVMIVAVSVMIVAVAMMMVAVIMVVVVVMFFFVMMFVNIIGIMFFVERWMVVTMHTIYC